MVKQIYKTAIIGPFVTIELASSSKPCDLSFADPIELEIKELTKGWNMVLDEQHCKVCGKCSCAYSSTVIMNSCIKLYII